MRNAPYSTKSDEQRRAMFANLGARGLLKRASRGALAPVHYGQKKFRSFAQKSPLKSELVIGGIVAAAGIYGGHKLKGIRALASWASKGGRVSRGMRTLALEAPVFLGADIATRRVLGGPKEKRSYEKSFKYLASAGVGGVGAEAGLRGAWALAGTRAGQFALSRGRHLGGLTIKKSLEFGIKGTKASYKGAKTLYRKYK